MIGCSFSKKAQKDDSDVFTKRSMSLTQKVMLLDLEALRTELKKETKQSLNKLDPKGHTLFDIAKSRGNYEIVPLLIEAGCSPYLPNSAGESLYNGNDIYHLNNYDSLYDQSFTSALYILRNTGWTSLSASVNSYEISCDAAINAILNQNKSKVSLSEFLDTTRNCKHSMSAEKANSILKDTFYKAIENKFDNMSDLISLIESSPKKSLNFTYNDDNRGQYKVHLLLVMDLFKYLNPVKSQLIISTIKALIGAKQEVLTYKWSENNKYRTTIVARDGEVIDPVVLDELKSILKDYYHDYLKEDEQ